MANSSVVGSDIGWAPVTSNNITRRNTLSTGADCSRRSGHYGTSAPNPIMQPAESLLRDPVFLLKVGKTTACRPGKLERRRRRGSAPQVDSATRSASNGGRPSERRSASMSSAMRESSASNSASGGRNLRGTRETKNGLRQPASIAAE